VYEQPADVMAEVKAKQKNDELQIASLSSRVTAAPIRTGRDGGMHATFLAKLKPQEVRETDGTIRYVVDENAAKRLGSYVNPPLETHPDTTGTAVAAKPAPAAKGGASYMTAAAESKPTPAPSRTSYAASESGIFGKMKSFFVGDDEKPVSSPVAAAKSVTKPAQRPAPIHQAAVPKPAAQPQPAPAKEPEQTAQAAPPAAMPARQSAASAASLMSGAAPTIPTGSFDTRWGAIR
jgi:hypothetical protein